MNNKSEQKDMLDAIEDELKTQINRLLTSKLDGFHEILSYQMGWTGEGSGAETRGKRIRPLLLLLTASSCGINWHHVLPAAACVELIHNFSLIHDDIEDNSDLRRGRITVWKKWGIAQGINAGDALFVLSNISIFDLLSNFQADKVIKCATILHQTCLDLTIGQFMDMSFENQTDITLEDYWIMIGGKTAALITACCLIGPTLSGVIEEKLLAYRDFGHYLGLSFQIQDDLLGIWGDSALMGKSNISDLVQGKKTLPVLYGIQHSTEFARRWKEGNISSQEAPDLANLLAEAGGLQYVQESADKMSNMALQSLRIAEPQGDAGNELFKLVSLLLNRAS